MENNPYHRIILDLSVQNYSECFQADVLNNIYHQEHCFAMNYLILGKSTIFILVIWVYSTRRKQSISEFSSIKLSY